MHFLRSTKCRFRLDVFLHLEKSIGARPDSIPRHRMAPGREFIINVAIPFVRDFRNRSLEAISIYNTIYRIFGYEGEEAENVTYVNWLSLLWNGAAKATEMYQPSTKTWLQVLYTYFADLTSRFCFTMFSSDIKYAPQ